MEILLRGATTSVTSRPFSKAGAVGDAGDGPAPTRACGFEGDVVNFSGGGCAERVFALRDARLAFEIIVAG